MIKLKLGDIKEESVEEIALRLSELGVDPSPLYRSVAKGEKEVEVECGPDILPYLKRNLEGLCQIYSIEERRSHGVVPLILLALFLDNLLLFYIIKLSLYSAEFGQVLNGVFNSTRAMEWFRILLGLFLTVGYFYALILYGKGPPITSWLGLTYRNGSVWVMIAYSLPLPSLYLISTESDLLRVLGLFAISISVGLVFHSVRNVSTSFVKFS